MFFKVSIFVCACIQGVVVLSQQYQQPRQGIADMWDPYTWIAPYQEAGYKSWTDYLQKAQEISKQLYKQWDSTGAANLFATGMSYAQQAATQAQKAAELAMYQAKDTMTMG